MSEFENRTLIRADELGHSGGLRGAGSKLPIVIIATLGLVLGGIGAWWWTRDAARPPQPAAAATGTDAELLKVETGAPLIYTERLTRDTNNRPVELAENWSVPSLALWVELHR